MRNLFRVLFATAAGTAVFIQGCGCSDNDKYYPPVESTYTVTGAASKGILRNFQVAAHRFNNGVLDTTPIASSNTSNVGTYTLKIPQTYANVPLLFRVTPNSTGSVMTCDLSAGCGGDVDFGEDLPITDSSFQLDAVVPSSANNSVANITLLTDLASELALDAISSGNSVTVIQAAVAAANSRIANRFGLVGNLTTLPIIDLTNYAAVNAALSGGHSLHIQYAAINAAIVQAARDGNTLNFVSAMNAFVTYFSSEGLAGNTTDLSEVSYADILAAARAVLGRVQEIPQASNLAALLQSLLVEQQLAENEEPDSYDQGTPSTGADATDLQKAKNMVNDLVDFAASVGESNLEGGLDVATVSEDFAMQLEAAELATSAHAKYLMDAVALAGAAVDDANRAYDSNNNLQSYTSDDGIVVAISVVDAMPVYTVDDAIDVAGDTGTVAVAVDMTARNRLVFDDASTETVEAAEVSGRYDLSGTASTSQLMLTVHDGYVLVEDLEHEQTAGNSTQAAESVDLRLNVSLAQVVPEGSDPVSLEGNLSVSLKDLTNEETEAGASGSQEIGLTTASLNFSGKVSNTTGESFNFSIAVSGDATGVSFVESWNSQGESSVGETEENYAALVANLAFTAQLTGIPSVVSVAYSLERTGLESGNNSLVIKYPAKLFRFSIAVEDGEPVNPLTVTNQDAAVLTLNESEEEGESKLDGDIKVNGVERAKIEERDAGVIVITYTDGTVRSL